MYIGATLGVGTGATTGVGKHLCNLLIIKLGVRGVTNIVTRINNDKFETNLNNYYNFAHKFE